MLVCYSAIVLQCYCAVQWSSFKFYNGIDLESFIQTDRATIRGPSGPKKISGIGKGQGSSLTIFLSSFGYNLLYIALPITNSRVHTFNVSIIQGYWIFHAVCYWRCGMYQYRGFDKVKSRAACL